MASRYYKLWLRNSGDTAWVEVTTFANLRFAHVINQIPWFTCQVFTGNSTLQNLLTVGRVFRITTLASTNGTVATYHNEDAGDGGSGVEVITGRITEAKSDEKSAVKNGTATIWHITGAGLLDFVRNTMYDAETIFRGQTVEAIIRTHGSSITATVGTGNITATDASIDTGPTISARLRKDNVLGILQDLAGVGDATNQFYYFLDATPSSAGVFKPVLVHYLAPNNAKYETTNPLSGVDNGRTLDAATELRSYNVVPENERIINSVVTRFAGMGSGEVQTDTAVANDTAYAEVRRAILYAPWLLPDTSGGTTSVGANLLRDTALNMYKGTSSGLKRADAVLKTGALFTSTFDAILGDVVSIRRDSSDTTGVITGRLLAYSYDQATEALSVTVGIPAPPTQAVSGAVPQRGRSYERVRSALQTAIVRNTAGAGGSGYVNSSHQVFAGHVAGGTASAASPLTLRDTINLPHGSTNIRPADGHEYLTVVEVSTHIPFDGPLAVQVELVSASGTTVVFAQDFPAMIGYAGTGNTGRTFYKQAVTYPFAAGVFDELLTQVRVRTVNQDQEQSFIWDSSDSGSNGSIHVSIYAVPKHNI